MMLQARRAAAYIISSDTPPLALPQQPGPLRGGRCCHRLFFSTVLPLQAPQGSSSADDASDANNAKYYGVTYHTSTYAHAYM